MRVLLNAVSIKEGGSLAVMNNLVPAMAAERPDVEWIAAVNERLRNADRLQGPMEQLDVADGSALSLARWYGWDLPAVLRRRRVDVLFSMTNYLPRGTKGHRTVLLEQHAGHFSESFERLYRAASPSSLAWAAWNTKTRWVHRSVEQADSLVVQTAALADAIAGSTRRPRSTIKVIPHGPGWVEHAVAPRSAPSGSRWRIGYVTKWGVQKDFATLVKAVATLRREGWPVTLVLTLDRGAPHTAAVLAAADRMGIRDIVENRGETGPSELGGLYDGMDIFAFPSLCESFGMPMVEAMARALPLVVADTPENREIAGTAALPFAREDADALADQLARLMADPDLWREASRASLMRSRDFSWGDAARQTLTALDSVAVAH